MQIITVKFFPVTNTKPARFQAFTSSGLKGAILSEHALGGDSYAENCKLAARQMAVSLRWSGEWVGGEVGGANSMVFVCCDPKNFDRFTV